MSERAYILLKDGTAAPAVAPSGTVYFAVGPYAYGRGDSVASAIRRMRRHWSPTYAGPYSIAKVSVWLATSDVAIDDMGQITATSLREVNLAAPGKRNT